jgi:hypothetical protein
MTGRNDNSKGKKFDSVFFWDTARRFLDHELPRIRKKAGIPFPPTAPRLTSALVFWRK